MITSSGMAAIDLVLSTVRRGDLVLAPHDCYGGTYRLLCARRDRDQFDVAFIDQGDTSALASAFARGPKLVLVETPSNPLMRVVDIREIALRAKAAGAKTAVDNTFSRQPCSGRSSMARTSSFTRPRNISMDIPTWSGVPSSPQILPMSKNYRPGRISPARSALRSTHI